MDTEGKTNATHDATNAGDGPTLTVRMSHVRVGGSTRVHESVPASIGASARDLVEVHYGEKAIAVHLFADRHVAPAEIVLRLADMRRLGVAEGEPVVLRAHVRGRDAVRGAFGRLRERFGSSDEDQDETAAKKEGE